MSVLLSGNEAIARGAYEAGATVAAAYPGTPSTEILENIANYKEEIYSEWAPNEKVAMEVAIGASFGGARSLAAMKHVGLNVAADPFLTLAYTGVKGGMVVVSADDPGMHSSQNEQDNRHFARLARAPLLEPSDSQEAKDFVKLAFKISEDYDTPVLLRTTTRISHAKTVTELEEREALSGPYKFEKDPEKYVMIPAFAQKRRKVVAERVEKLERLTEETARNRVEWGDKKVGVITSGVEYQYVKEALPEASVLKLGLSYPIPRDMIKSFAQKVEQLYVVEELDPFIEEQIKAMGIPVIGKEKIPALYELDQGIVREKLTGEKADKVSYPAVTLPQRPPVLCPGCPHRGVFYVLKKLKLAVMGDIGCYTLGVVPPLSSIDTCVCMGASVGMTFGLELALGKESDQKVVGVIGDSTFVHSGITGLIDIAYNKGTSTIMVLDNRTTGMTGHQDHPATGKTLMGENTKSLDLEQISKACGVDNVRVIDAYDLKHVEKVVTEEINREAPSVIITRNHCVLIHRESRKPPLYIDPEACKNCGMCLRVGCPAIYQDGEVVQIDRNFCVGCEICLQVCNFEAIKKAGEDNE